MIIEYDYEDRCIRIDDVAVSHAEVERLMNEHETAATALEYWAILTELFRRSTSRPSFSWTVIR